MHICTYPWPARPTERLVRLAMAWTLGCLFIAASVWPGAARAQTSVMIWPLDPVIEDDQRAAAMWLENRGTQAVSLQVRIFAWTQTGGSESYDNQSDVVPSPPTATIQPGQRQLVRLMKTNAVPEGRELAYRILVDELPSTESVSGLDLANGQASGNSMGIKLQIRYSVPLFVSGKGHWTRARADKKRDPETAAQPVLSWNTVQEDGNYFLQVRNTGGAHARLSAVQWVRGTDTQTINAGLLGYVLADTQMRWRLESAPPPGFVLQTRVNTSDTPVQPAAR